MSDRLLNVPAGVTQINVGFSQDGYRCYLFEPLHILIEISVGSIHFSGGTGWGRELQYCLPIFNQIVAQHFNPTHAKVTAAFDPEFRKGR